MLTVLIILGCVIAGIWILAWLVSAAILLFVGGSAVRQGRPTIRRSRR